MFPFSKWLVFTCRSLAGLARRLTPRGELAANGLEMAANRVTSSRICQETADILRRVVADQRRRFSGKNAPSQRQQGRRWLGLEGDYCYIIDENFCRNRRL
jgi:hypothetical protein